MAGGAARLRVPGCDGRTRRKVGELLEQPDLNEQIEEVQIWTLDLIKQLEEGRY